MAVFNSFFSASNDGWRVRDTDKSGGPLTLTAYAIRAVVRRAPGRSPADTSPSTRGARLDIVQAAPLAPFNLHPAT